MSESISNLFVDEGTLVSEFKAFPLPWRARHVEIINDSALNDLKYRFKPSQDWATLKPLEVSTTSIKPKTVHLQGNGPYRIRAEG